MTQALAPDQSEEEQMGVMDRIGVGLAAALFTSGCGDGEISAVASLASFGSTPDGPVYDKPVVGETYPDLCLLDSNGDEVCLSEFEDKIVLIEPIGMT